MCEHSDDQGSHDIVIEGEMVPIVAGKSFVLVTASGRGSLVMGLSTEILSYFHSGLSVMHRPYL